MSRIRIKAIPPEFYDSAVRFAVIPASAYGRVKGRQLASTADLLQEAIRFYNYGISATPQQAIHKRDWLPITSANISSATRQLHARLVDKTYAMAKQLATWRQGKAPNLEPHLKARKENTEQENKERDTLLADSAHATVLAADLFLSPAHRNPGYVAQLRQTRDHGKILFREFEQLTAALQGDSRNKSQTPLRSLISRERIQRELLQQYADELQSANPLEQLFLPQWGGASVIQPAEIRKPGGKTQPWEASAPFWPHKPAKSGPTEKLYFCLASEIFRDIHQQADRSPPKNIPTQCGWLADLNASIRNIERILPLSLSDLEPWSSWLRNLEWLAYLFEQALAVRRDAWLEDDSSQSTRRVNDYAVGIHTGLVAGLALAGILRAYLVDRIACTLMVSLPLAIDKVYHNVSGCFGVVLYEALWGNAIPTLSESSASQLVNPKLVNALGDWHSLPLDNFWGTDEDPVNQACRQVYWECSSARIRECSRSPGLTTPAQKTAVTANTYSRCFDRYPPILPAFYRGLGLSDRKPISHYLSGARFTMQAQVFVAMQVLHKALPMLGLTAGFEQDESQREKKLGRHRRYLKNLKINAGSYLWGGKKPPHSSHRNGACFDFAFGPRIPQWPGSKLKAHIEELAAADPRFHQYLQQDEDGVPRKILYDDPLVVAHYQSEADAMEHIRYPRQFIFRRLVNRVLHAAWNKLGAYCDASLEGKDFDFSAAEARAYEDAEKPLYGTPDIWYQPDLHNRLGIPVAERTSLADWQRVHAAHIAIMLSAPRRIIYASPLIHLRCMRAIRQGLQANAEVTQLAAELVKGVYFAFLPQDHHHHWHVDYLPTTGCWQPRSGCGEAWPAQQRVTRLSRFFPLWLALGIDLEPLLIYLQNYPGYGARSDAMREATEEYVALVEAVKEYQSAYRARFFPGNEFNPDAMDAASALLKNVVTHFDADGYYVKTRFSTQPFPSRQITEAIQRSGSFVQNFLTQVRTSPYASKVMLDLSAYEFVHYLELWGLQETVEE